ELFRAQSGVFARHDINDVLDGVGRDTGGVIGVGVGPGEIALDHRLDVELADLVSVTIPRNPHDADPALAIFVLDQWRPRTLPSARRPSCRAQLREDNEHRSCQRASGYCAPSPLRARPD